MPPPSRLPGWTPRSRVIPQHRPPLAQELLPLTSGQPPQCNGQQKLPRWHALVRAGRRPRGQKRRAAEGIQDATSRRAAPRKPPPPSPSVPRLQPPPSLVDEGGWPARRRVGDVAATADTTTTATATAATAATVGASQVEALTVKGGARSISEPVGVAPGIVRPQPRRQHPVRAAVDVAAAVPRRLPPRPSAARQDTRPPSASGGTMGLPSPPNALLQRAGNTSTGQGLGRGLPPPWTPPLPLPSTPPLPSPGGFQRAEAARAQMSPSHGTACRTARSTVRYHRRHV